MAKHKSAGMLALFDSPDTVLRAAEKARDAGFKKWDVFTPFPVHGMDDAMGLGRSNIPWLTFFAGLTGLASALFIQYGTMVYSWPLNIGGKPHNAWPSFIPITFEMTVLFAGLATAFGALLVGGVFQSKPKFHPDITSHRFAIFLDRTDPSYEEQASRTMFEEMGAVEVSLVKEDAR